MKLGLKTPVALAILNLLHERPMHPYEMRRLMQERAHDAVINLNVGSLYSTIARLASAGLIEALRTSREGRRPERTVYTITTAGREELLGWLRELLARPAHEYPWFGAALAFLAALPPDDVLDLLTQRATLLETELGAAQGAASAMTQRGVPRLFGVEDEYAQAMRRAELAWVRQVVDDIQGGRLTWPPEALAVHATLAQAHHP